MIVTIVKVVPKNIHQYEFRNHLIRLFNATGYNEYCNVGFFDTSEVKHFDRCFAGLIEGSHRDLAFHWNGSGLSEWNVGNGKTFVGMFYGNINFNQPLHNFDMRNAESTKYMFSGCTSFNQDVSYWKFENLSFIDYMFAGTIYFNQDISRWNVSNVGSANSFLDLKNTTSGLGTTQDYEYILQELANGNDINAIAERTGYSNNKKALQSLRKLGNKNRVILKY